MEQKQNKLETFRGKDILPIDRFPSDERVILSHSCTTILAQIILRDQRIRELQLRLKDLERDTLVQQNLLPDIPAD